MPEVLDRRQLMRFLLESDPLLYIVLVGAPGSGKTTIAETWEHDGLLCVSTDRMLFRNPWMHTMLDMLEREYWKEVDAALASRKPIVDDNLNILRANRQALAKRVSAQGYKLVYVLVDASLELCLRQNKQRQPFVPDGRLTMLWEELQQERPDASEGTVFRLVPITEENRYEVTPVLERRAQVKKPWWKRLLDLLGLG